jgi:hypothetical protein
LNQKENDSAQRGQFSNETSLNPSSKFHLYVDS